MNAKEERDTTEENESRCSKETHGSCVRSALKKAKKGLLLLLLYRVAVEEDELQCGSGVFIVDAEISEMWIAEMTLESEKNYPYTICTIMANTNKPAVQS